jgi:hypothetical protein
VGAPAKFVVKRETQDTDIIGKNQRRVHESDWRKMIFFLFVEYDTLRF